MSNDAKARLRRIYGNINHLITEFSFPGKFAPAVLEAQQLVQEVLTELKEPDSGEQQGKEAGVGAGDEAGAGRVVDGGVPNQGRKSRKRKGD